MLFLTENDSITIASPQITIGVGWDTLPLNPAPLNLLGEFLDGGSIKSDTVECDLMTVLCDEEGHMQDNGDIVFFNNLSHISGSVNQADDENLPKGFNGIIDIDLASLPKQYAKIVFAASIYQARARHHHLSMLANLFISVFDHHLEEIGRFEIKQIDGNITMLHLAQMVYTQSGWQFEILNRGTSQDGAAELAKCYQ